MWTQVSLSSGQMVRTCWVDRTVRAGQVIVFKGDVQRWDVVEGCMARPARNLM